MSVATGIGPAELVELDGAMFDALVEAIDTRWSPELELAAELVELESALVVAYLQAHSTKRLTLKPIVVPRPNVDELELEPAPASTRVGVLELASLAGKALTPSEAASG